MLSRSSRTVESGTVIVMQPKEHAYPSDVQIEADFRVFLRENEYYNPKTALELLLSYGLMHDFFIVRDCYLKLHDLGHQCLQLDESQVARTRRMGAYALRLLANNGSLHIEPKLVPLLKVKQEMSGEGKSV